MADDADPLIRRPPQDPAEAQARSMNRLRRALLKRVEHAEQAKAWRDVDRRNHFGPSIAKAMRLGRDGA